MHSKMHPWILIACVGAMCAVGFAEASAGVPDAWISTKVKMMLLNSPQVSGMPINVDTDDGRVTLHGTVPSASEKKEAGRIALAGTGVTSVRNLLQVVTKSRRKAVAVADDRIQDAVRADLENEVALANSSIQVKSVHKGVVLLSGKAATLSDHLRALEVTSEVRGVRQVASEIVSPDEFADREIWLDEPASPPATGNAVTDGWITTQTKMRFMTDDEIPAGDINVDTRRGVVTLFGTVPTAAVRDKAVRVAEEVAGVKSVTRQLRVVPASKRARAIAQDDAIEAAVRKHIADANMEGADVKVEVRAATARLTGTVRRALDRYSAVAITRGTPGVARVQNDLRIEAPQTSQR